MQTNAQLSERSPTRQAQRRENPIQFRHAANRRGLIHGLHDPAHAQLLAGLRESKNMEGSISRHIPAIANVLYFIVGLVSGLLHRLNNNQCAMLQPALRRSYRRQQ